MEGELIVYRRNFENRGSLTKCGSFEEAIVAGDDKIYDENISFGGIDGIPYNPAFVMLTIIPAVIPWPVASPTTTYKLFLSSCGK